MNRNSMRVIVGIAVLCAAAQAAPTPDAPGPIQPPPKAPRLGMNFNGLADWNTELPLVDVFREARAWISQREGAAWGKGPALDLDASGWIKSLAPGAHALTCLLTIPEGHAPAGLYTVLYDGEGEMTFRQATAVESGPGRIVIRRRAPNPGVVPLI